MTAVCAQTSQKWSPSFPELESKVGFERTQLEHYESSPNSHPRTRYDLSIRPSGGLQTLV
ncbi:hypothetical protein COLO4_32198 [Corchorus olitorius]|uniref:Uncharacterized protein n=1 Tax=Corchorus olitorius TaxID=93759 RepID=A0A1R3H0G0_9ROSI|nr:hypothetical protein COLO4_32198 [Corchorus olitorius]